MSEINFSIKSEYTANGSLESNNEIAKNIKNSKNELKSSLKENSITKNITDNSKTITSSLKNTDNISAQLNNTNPSNVQNYSYVHIKFSHSLPTSNSDMLNVPDDETWYMGICSNLSSTAPISYSAYSWVQIRGNDGESIQGEKGEKGEKGDSGEAALFIVNPLFFTGQLDNNNWRRVERNNQFIYQQKIYITDMELKSNNFSEKEYEELLQLREDIYKYLDLKITDNCTPLVDVIVSSTDVERGLKEIEQWTYISRVYIVREMQVIEEETKVEYCIYFECYDKAPDILLRYQVKVI